MYIIYKSKRLLNIDNNAKTIKGQKLKVKTAIYTWRQPMRAVLICAQWPAPDVRPRVYSRQAGASLTM